MVLAILCGVACTTAASRCTWAFARDGAIPGAKWWSKVHPTLDLPLNAMMLSMAIQIALGLIWFGSPVAFNAFSGVGVISLTLSYAMPILASMIGGREQMKAAKFPLGKFGWVANGIALGMLLLFPLRCSVAVRAWLIPSSQQVGRLSRCPFSACPPCCPSRPPASTTPPWYWWASPSSPRCGTLSGAARTTAHHDL
jgi:amino acid transporter